MALSKGQEIHLESLSLDNYISHVNSEFITYASCGIFRLGWKGGCYVVLDRNSEMLFYSMQPYQALSKYIELIKENN